MTPEYAPVKYTRIPHAVQYMRYDEALQAERQANVLKRSRLDM